MASKRKYGYYIKGNKIAIIEEGTGSGICSLSGYSSQSTCETAGGTWTENAVSTNDGEYRSPVATVSDGLEIQYAYSPRYTVPIKKVDSVHADNYHTYGCWFAVDGYLTLGAAVVDFTDYSNITVDSYILIEGSERWNGLHKVKAIQDIDGGSHGGLQTYTKVNQATKYFTDNDVDYIVAPTDTITGVDVEFDDIFSASPSSNEYIWLAGSAAVNGDNNGLYSGWSFSSTTLSLSSATLYYTASNTEYTADATLTGDTTVTIYMYEAFRENGSAKFYSGVDVMDDEAFDLDLNRYQANAVVNYVKAKYAEDMGDLERKEYFMREFRMMVEKHDRGKAWGSRRMLSSGVFNR